MMMMKDLRMHQTILTMNGQFFDSEPSLIPNDEEEYEIEEEEEEEEDKDEFE